MDPQLRDWLIGGGALTIMTALTGALKVWWDRRSKDKKENRFFKLAKEAMKYDKQDAATIFESYVKNNKDKKE